MAVRVKKELFLNGAECRARAWYMHHDESTRAPTLAERFRMEQGLDVHRRARMLYPNGALVVEGNVEQAAARTQELMKDVTASTIFEAAFIAEGFVTKADILVRDSDGWSLVEVKSSVNNKPEFIDDMAYTAMVMQLAGCPCQRATLLLVSRDFRLGMNEGELFESYDRTDAVRSRIIDFIEIADSVASAVRAGDRPDCAIIPACRDCRYFATECLGRGVDHPIFDLPRLGGPRFAGLAEAGVVDVNDIPTDYDLTDKQERIRSIIVSGNPVAGDDLGNLLDEVVWPAYYLDFETFMTAVPLYVDTEPYRAIPTQFSVHVCAAPGNTTDHYEYLASPDSDPRPALAERLVSALGAEGSIVVYSAYEKRILNDLASVCPDLGNRINGLIERLVDLEKIFKTQYTHPDFHGKTSIKVTLPVLVPEMSYEGLDIGDGDNASAAFAFLAWGRYSATEANTVRENLLRYCKQDTLAMVQLHQRMLQIAGRAAVRRTR